jgi:hypothetical protein
MDFEAGIDNRLDVMESSIDPSNIYWPEKCKGSQIELVIFVGPSSGEMKKQTEKGAKLNFENPLWSEANR